MHDTLLANQLKRQNQISIYCEYDFRKLHKNESFFSFCLPSNENILLFLIKMTTTLFFVTKVFITQQNMIINILLLVVIPFANTILVTIDNRLPQYDVNGSIIDVHDGTIQQFETGGLYYMHAM